jgi:hypothetical protein
MKNKDKKTKSNKATCFNELDPFNKTEYAEIIDIKRRAKNLKLFDNLTLNLFKGTMEKIVKNNKTGLVPSSLSGNPNVQLSVVRKIPIIIENSIKGFLV